MYHPTSADDVPEPDDGGAPGDEPTPTNREYEAADEESRRIQATDDAPARWEEARAIAEGIVRQAMVDAQNGKSDDVATDPNVRAEIEHGLLSNNLKERLEWARAPLYQYKSSLSNADFARLANLQRQISPFSGVRREGADNSVDEIGDAARDFVERSTRPYVNFYRSSIADPIWRGIEEIARSPAGDPGSGHH